MTIFRNFWGSTKAVRQLSDTICIENGLSIVENPKPHGKSYNKSIIVPLLISTVTMLSLQTANTRNVCLRPGLA